MVEAPEEPGSPEPPEPPGRPEKPKNWALEWFSKNPVFGLISFLVGVVSLTATVYFGIATLRSRDLSLTVDPTRTTIVRAGQSSDLHVLYKGQSVATDVTGLQVGIWNAGRESIRPEHILSPIVLQTSPKVPILEVRVRHTSRPVCGIVLDDSQLADGKVGMSWRILEHNDGAVIQLIVAGGSNTSVIGEGALEGQRKINIMDRHDIRWQGVAVMVVLFLISGPIIVLIVRGVVGPYGGFSLKRMAVMAIVCAAFSALFTMEIVSYYGNPVPFLIR